MKELANKTAIVTGAARGIGKAIALKLAEQGCNIVVSDIDLTGAQGVAEEIKKMGPKAIAVQTNVALLTEAENLVAEAVKEFGQIDILVNNAGITRDNILLKMKESDWDSVIAVNLKGTFNCIKAATRTFLKQKFGKIINISSVVGIIGNISQVNYSASKAGVIGITKSVAKELGSRNIQVNAVAPGYIETEMTENLRQEAKEAFLKSIPLNKPGTPQDVANVVLFLSSSASDYVTGQVLNVDGGLVM